MGYLRDKKTKKEVRKLLHQGVDPYLAGRDIPGNSEKDSLS